jgi:hypothetical protein
MSEAAISRTFVLSRRLSVEITAGTGGMVVEWHPDVPERLTGGELRRYRRARNEMLGELAKRLGGDILVVEM